MDSQTWWARDPAEANYSTSLAGGVLDLPGERWIRLISKVNSEEYLIERTFLELLRPLRDKYGLLKAVERLEILSQIMNFLMPLLEKAMEYHKCDDPEPLRDLCRYFVDRVMSPAFELKGRTHKCSTIIY